MPPQSLNSTAVSELTAVAGFCFCADTDYYGRTFISWDAGTGAEQNLAPHLDPQNSGERVVDGAYLNALRAKAK